MKNLRMIFASFALLALSTLFASNVKAQTTCYYLFNKTFNANAVSAPSTTDLGVTTNYVPTTPGPIAPDPCGDGDFFCGFKVSPCPAANDLQCIVNAIQAKANGYISLGVRKWLRHADVFTTSCNNTTYTITTYLRVDDPGGNK